MLAIEPLIEPTEKITNAKPIIANFTIAEYLSPNRAKQTASAEPPQSIEQTAAAQTTSPPIVQTGPPPTAQTTPFPPFKDEGYGHGVTLDSMIVTPHVPTLVEESINVNRGQNRDSRRKSKRICYHLLYH